MGGVIIHRRALPALDLPSARDDIEKANRMVALPDDGAAASVSRLRGLGPHRVERERRPDR